MRHSYTRITSIGLITTAALCAFAAASDLQPRMGQPLDGLTPAQLARFEIGSQEFNRTFQAEEGLGPIMNNTSCGTCHNNPLGGSGSVTVTRAGILDEKGGGFDPLANLGGSLFQQTSINVMCMEVVPPEANIVALRLTPSALGFGLVEAIPDDDIAANADPGNPFPGISGAARIVEPVEDPGVDRVGRFGWKAGVATILTFSADASLNEMGITTPFFPDENDPNGVNPPSLGECDMVADPEEDLDFLNEITDFQRFLAPPPQTPKSGMTGEAIFASIGCTDCHIPSFQTSNDPGLEDAIRNKTLRPYSNFLLHSMGLLFDGIVDGTAGPDEIRTTPLWGLRVRDPMLHDGSAIGGTFETRVTQAILDHGQVGSEAKAAVDEFIALSPADQALVVQFLDSLGRAEFDMDGDNDIDPLDFAAFVSCFNGPQGYTPDDHCAISDFNQDTQVDCTDYDAFTKAWTDTLPKQPGGPQPPPAFGPCGAEIPDLPSVPAAGIWSMFILLLVLGVAVAVMSRRPHDA